MIPKTPRMVKGNPFPTVPTLNAVGIVNEIPLVSKFIPKAVRVMDLEVGEIGMYWRWWGA